MTVICFLSMFQKPSACELQKHHVTNGASDQMVKFLVSDMNSRTRAPATYQDRTPVLQPSEPNKAADLWESILCEDPNNPTAIRMIQRRVTCPDSVVLTEKDLCGQSVKRSASGERDTLRKYKYPTDDRYP